jgi:hypothetical protein
MATSPEAFRQVKNILQKLDQSIDAARDRRLTSKPRGATASAGASTTPVSPGSVNGSGHAGPIGGAHGAKPAPDTNLNRAKPLPPRHDPNRGFIRPGDPAQR